MFSKIIGLRSQIQESHQLFFPAFRGFSEAWLGHGLGNIVGNCIEGNIIIKS